MFAALAAIATNLRRTIGFYFIVTLNSIAIVNAGESLGIIFNTIFNDNTGLALNVTNVLLSVSNFMAGTHCPCPLASLVLIMNDG